MILLIDNYDSFTFNLYQYVEELGVRCKVIRNDKITIDGIRKLKPEKIILSPGPGNPNDSGICIDVVKELQGEFPILGVCLGHQTIGQVFGGKVVRARRMMHGKVSEVTHTQSQLFRDIPKRFNATRYHSLVVDEKSFPIRELKVTARTDDGMIMALEHRKLPIYGVQFHPESIMTGEGKKILSNFLELKSRRPRK